MISSEQILEEAASDGSIDLAEWPRVLENVLQRLNDIVHNSFPLPPLPLPAPPIDPEVVASTPPHASSSSTAQRDSDLSLPDADADADDTLPPDSSQSSTKENDAPPSAATPKPPVPKFHDAVAAQQSTQPPPDALEPQPGTLPPDLLSSYQSSARLLEYDFAHSPPYTIQRLAELVLYPRKHYRFLPAYLRALDRVVSVSSPVSDFPLPSGNGNGSNGNGEGSSMANSDGMQERDGLGSDESLGGALLTPIPWLRHNNGNGNGGEGELHSESTETILGPHGAGSIETVSVTVNGIASTAGPQNSPGTSTPASPTLSEQSDASTGSSTASVTDAQLREQGGVTQGELLRQEQEAGVVPVAQSAPRRTLLSSGAVAVGRENEGAMDSEAPESADEKPEEHPHARGPEVIGMEDMGPQDPKHGPGGGLDMEAAVGRGRSPPPAAARGERAEGAERAMEEAMKDDAGQAGVEPGDAEKEAERVREQEVLEKEKEGKDGGEGVEVTDADGMTGIEREKAEETGEGPGPGAVDTTGL